MILWRLRAGDEGRMSDYVVDWLLGEGNQPVRFLTLTSLLGRSKRSRETRAARSQLMQYSVTREILCHTEELLKDAGKLKRVWGYDKLYWQVAVLGQFLADGKDARVGRLASYILADHRWYPRSTRGIATAPCYAAMVLSALMQLGYREDAVTSQLTDELARRIVADDGIVCAGMDYCLLSRCYMALPKLLLCLGLTPVARRTAAVSAAIDLIVDKLLKHEVYVYVPASRGKWQKTLDRAPKRAELPKGQTVKGWIRKKRQAFVRTHDLDDRMSKKGWLKFGFPLGYNSDVLEAMYALTLVGAPMSRELERPLLAIKDKMRPDGTWVLENSLNGKMLVDVEEKGKPSKWLTYRALRVLRHFQE